MRKFIIVTGGVISGLGKGIAAASIGKLLSNNFKVIPVKCEGYLNVDPGTMNPYEHGEVFVLEDGEEADMDFGHYERFIGVNCKAKWNITMGKVFQGVNEKERRGDYLGKTVQYIPHVTNYIKGKWNEIAQEENADILLIEIGGTVGDIETELHIEAARQLRRDYGDENVLYVHLTYIPVPENVKEQKTKPTQQSVNLLSERGIQADIIIGRCKEPLTEKSKEKIALFCNVKKEAVISGHDVQSVYEVPLLYDNQNILEIIKDKLKIEVHPELKEWNNLVYNIYHPEKEINIAICGKYTDLEDSYVSINEALVHSGAHFKTIVKTKFVETDDNATNFEQINSQLSNVDAVIVPGGFGKRGTDGKINVIKYCREKNIPFLGICLGLQLAVSEFARNICGLENANSTEFDSSTKYPVIDILPEQINVTHKGGSMRLGSCIANVLENSLISKLYNSTKVSERHRHRYEVNPSYHQILQQKGLLLSGMSENGRLVEFIELPNHKYFVATQSHPELKSSLLKPAPMFYGLVSSALNL